jgi:hypothetical protein
MYNQVSIQGKEKFISPYLFNEESAKEWIKLEAWLHEMTGWSVTIKGDLCLECSKGNVHRTIYFVREER